MTHSDITNAKEPPEAKAANKPTCPGTTKAGAPCKGTQLWPDGKCRVHSPLSGFDPVATGKKGGRHLDDASRRRMETMFGDLTDAQAVEHLLAIHKFVELHSTGKGTLLAEAEAHALGLTLLRLAPQALNDGLALYMEGLEERGDQIMCANCSRVSDSQAPGWQTYLSDEEPLVAESFCPECRA